MRSGSPPTRWTVFVTAFCLGLLLAVDASALRDTERVIQASNSFQGNSTSYIIKGTILPAGVTTLILEYDYFVASELNADFFRCDYYDGSNGWVNLFSMSGHRSGRNSHTVLPSSPAPFRVRFSFTKNASVDTELDMAWVDNVVVKSNKGRLATYRFLGEPHVGNKPEGWSAGGTGGGWKLKRPPVERSVGPPENQQADTYTQMSKQIHFPTAVENKCTFDYVVDTAPGHELRIYEGNTSRFSISGANQGTSDVVPMSETAGPRWVSLRHYRDATPIEGLNLVRLDDLTCYSDGKVVERIGFDGQAPATTPVGWSSSCVSTGGSCSGGVGWKIRRPTPHRSYVEPRDPGTEPAVDGRPTSDDETRVLVPNWALTGGNERDMYLSVYDNGTDPASLYLFVRLRSTTDGTEGDESGYFMVVYDDQRDLTLSRTGTCADWQEPGNEDRRLYFAYDLASSTASQSFSAPTLQFKGACTGGWAALDGADTGPLAATAEIVDPGGGTLGLEIKIELSSITKSQGRVGIGFRRVTKGALYEHFPYLQDSQASPHESDTTTYETIELSALPDAGPLLTEDFDHCCYPKSSRRH